MVVEINAYGDIYSTIFYAVRCTAELACLKSAVVKSFPALMVRRLRRTEMLPPYIITLSMYASNQP